MGRAGRRPLPQRGGLPEAKRRGRARSRREGLDTELQRLDLAADATPATGTGLLYHQPPQNDLGGTSPPNPLAAAWASLQELGLVQRCVPVQCRPATDEELSPELLEPQGPPPKNPPDASRWAAGSVLELLGKVLSGELRNGLALLQPGGCDTIDALAVATRAAQRHPQGQRILLVNWCLRPSPTLPQLCQEEPRVLYFGVHRGGDPPPPANGFSVHVNWEEAGRTDGDYVAAFCHLLLPIAFQFQPQLVLVAAGFDATLGDPEGHKGVSPAGYALMTHLLAALAGGRLLLALQGGWSPGALEGGLGAVLRTLLGDPGEPPGPLIPTPSGLASVAQTLATHRQYWSCLSAEPEAEEDEEQEDEEKEEEEEDEEELGGEGGCPETPVEPEEEEEEHEEEELRCYEKPQARTGLVYDERMEEHCNPWDSQHPEAPQRLGRVLQRLRELGLSQRCLRLPVLPASHAQLTACHSASHVWRVRASSGLRGRALRAAAQRYDSVFLCPASFRCARLAAGAACAAACAVARGQVQNALAVVRPPGHHAGRARAGGFCLFNNVAAAARAGQSLAGEGLRVLILDWDVHHGNGTQQIFEEDPSVLYISLHRGDGSFFPGGSGGSPRRRGRGRGTGFTLNVAWGGPRVGDPEYLAAMTRLVLPVACQFGPQLVLVSAGFDAGRGDPLGGCLVSPQTFGLMTHLLGGLAGGRLVLVLEGGYNLGVLSEGVGQCLRVLLGDPPTLPPPPGPLPPAALRALARTRRAQTPSWGCLRMPPARDQPPPSAAPPDDVTAPPPTPPLAAAILGLGQLRLADTPPAGGGATAEGAEPPPDHAPPEGASAAPSPPPACWEEEEEPEGALFAVAPLLDCPHLGAVRPLAEAEAEGRGLGAAPPCGACGSRRENWLCLTCHQVLCGRYVGGHMVAHGGVTGHPLVLGLRDLSVWCYPCGGYVQHTVLHPPKRLLYRLKFGADPPEPSL